jgi:hypothetical protein
MRVAVVAGLSFVLCAEAAGAAPVTGAARDAYAGEWRANVGSSASACGAGTQAGAVHFTLEFAMTGGSMFVDDNSESAGRQTVQAIDDVGGTLTLKLQDGSWTFKHAAGGVLISDHPLEAYSQMHGLTFRHCVPAAERSAIHLTPAQARGISSAMPGGPILIDSRAPKGCKAALYQYLSFDVVGPGGFVLHRWNSAAAGEKLADGGKLGFATDEITDFTIDQADAIPGGYRFKVTELIPPNGSRGDTTTITVNIKGGAATIPEWKRSYAVCTAYTP